jgi:WD40 repeat protein
MTLRNRCTPQISLAMLVATALAISSCSSGSTKAPTGPGAEVARLKGADTPVDSIQFSVDDTLVIDVEFDGTTHSWNVSNGKRKTVSERDGNATAVSPDGTMVANSNFSTRVASAILSDVASGKQITTIPGDGQQVSQLAFSGDGSRLAVISGLDALRVFDVHTGELLATFSAVDTLQEPVFSADSTEVATAVDEGNSMLVFSIDRAELVATIDAPNLVGIVAFSPNGKTIATSGAIGDNDVHIWDSTSGKSVEVLTSGSQLVDFVYSPTGDRIAVALANGGVNVFDVASGRIVATAQGPKFLRTISFSPDGTQLLTAGKDPAANLWDAKSGALVATFDTRGTETDHAAFNHAGSQIVTATVERTVTVWATK